MIAPLVVDVSVVAKWFVQEPGSQQADALLGGRRLLAPELVVAELGNVFWKKVRRGDMTIQQARFAVASFLVEIAP